MNHKLKPAVGHIGIPPDGSPFLIGCRCGNCDEVFVGDRATCARCGARGKMRPFELSDTGRIHTFSIVHRSFPGIKTPFVSAMISLDGGGNVQSTVRDVATDAPAALFDLSVKLHFEVTNQLNREGANFLAYYFSATDGVPGASDV